MWKIIGTKIIEYFSYLMTKEFLRKCKIALKKALKAFVKALWKELKEEIRKQVVIGIMKAREYCLSEEAKIHEEFVLDYVMRNIKLPVFLKPFRGLIKSLLKNKLERLIHSLLFKNTKVQELLKTENQENL